MSSSHRFIAFLDLVSCTFGAAVLLFLIASTSSAPRGQAAPGSLVLVRCVPAGEARGEVVIELRPPGSSSWIRPRHGDARQAFFAATSEPTSGAEAVLVLFSPPSGEWQLRPCLVDFPRGAARGPVSVTLEVLGENVTLEDPVPPPRPMPFPGDVGQTVRVFLGRPRQGGQ